MKKFLFAAPCLLLLFAMPAEARIFHHRGFLHHGFQSPLVHQLVNYGASQLMPILQDAANSQRDNTDTRIFLDSSVKSNLDKTKSNLKDANDIIQDLLIKNKLQD